jgi:hypothetical protein
MTEGEPRKILVGAFPIGMAGGTLAFTDIEGELIREANRKADAERDLARAIDAGDYSARLAAARKRNRLRLDLAFCKATTT